MPSDLKPLVAAFGEELAELAFDPEADGVPEATLAEYRQAVAAYERARSLARRAPDGWTSRKILRILAAGRAALVRLEARMNGRPVPVDAVRPLIEDATP